jgi:hypothetical protein
MADAYKQIIDNSHRMFTVFTGAALSFYIADLFVANEPAWRLCVTPAAIALMLRYILGSAVHLNCTYGVPADKKPKVKWLLFDILWLVFFGFLIVYMIRAVDLDAFMWRAFYFVLSGFTWSLIAYCFRGDKQTEIGKRWLLIDGLQLVFTLFALFILGNILSYGLPDDNIEVGTAIILALGYLFFLYFDFDNMIKWAASVTDVA